jgi:hypothetical protein
VIARAIRPWRLNCTVTALRAAFPGAKVHIRHYDPRAGFADFAVSQPVTITDTRELLSMTTSWAPRRLRITAEVLNACPHEAAMAALIAGVVPKLERGAVVKLGEVRQAETEAASPQEPVIAEPAVAEQAPTKARPRVGLGRRVPPEELRQRLRGVVIR